MTTATAKTPLTRTRLLVGVLAWGVHRQGKTWTRGVTYRDLRTGTDVLVVSRGLDTSVVRTADGREWHVPTAFLAAEDSPV